MNVLRIEQSKAAYWADFALYGTTIVVVAVALVVDTPHAQWISVAFLAITGMLGWSTLEYLVHRFFSWRAAISALACRTSRASHGLHLRARARHGLATRYVPLFTRLVDGRRLECLRSNARRVQRWHFIHHKARRPCYGVTSGISDTACGNKRPDRKSATERASD
jgi:hypothetical protein